MTSSDPREVFLRRYQADEFSHPAMVNHRGAVVAFAMGRERRIFYSVLDLNDGDSPFDKDHWLQAPKELPFPREIAEVGYGIAGETQLPLMALPAAGTPVEVKDLDNVLPSEIDGFWSSTGRLTADVPFQVYSDDQHIYVFRQAVGFDDGEHTAWKRDADGEDITRTVNGKDEKVPLADRTMLVDRYLLGQGTLSLKREVRFRRSRSRTRPDGPKDSLGAKDMNGNPFYESTQELSFIRNLVGGRFTVTQLPTAVAELSRWQIFACSGKSEDGLTVADDQPVQVVDSYNIERSADGRFDARGTQIYTSPDPEYQSSVYEREPGTCPFTGLALVPRVSASGYAEYALALDGQARIEVDASTSLSPDDAWTVELWLRLRSASDDEAVVFERGADGEGRLTIAGGVLTYEENSVVRSADAEIPVGEWTHVSVTRGATDVSFIVNGEAAGDGDLPEYQPPTSGLTFGRGLDADIDEIRIWEYARHPLAVNERRSNRLIGNEPGLCALWRLDEGGGAVLRDQTDHENDARLEVEAGIEPDSVWISSDAPIGDNPGIRRSSFFIAGRDVVTGMSSVTYQESESSSASGSTAAKPMKQLTRTMLALVTAPSETQEPTAPDGASDSDDAGGPDDADAADEQKPLISIVDFAVSREGRLAQVRDEIDLTPLKSTFLSSMTGLLKEESAAVYALARKIDPDGPDRSPGHVADDSDPVAAVTLFESGLRDLSAWAGDLAAQTSPESVSAAGSEAENLKQTRTKQRGQRTRLESSITAAEEALAGAETARDEAVVAHDEAKAGLAAATESEAAANAVVKEESGDVESAEDELKKAEAALKGAEASGKNDQIRDAKRQVTRRKRQLTAAKRALTAAETALAEATAARAAAKTDADTAGTAVNHAEAAVAKARKELDTTRENTQPEIDELATEIDELTARIDHLDTFIANAETYGVEARAAQVRIDGHQAAAQNLGESHEMVLVDVDRLGLTTTGGRLDFAWTSAAPLLSASSDGEIVLYFQGVASDENGTSGGQFYAAYYDVNTARASCDLPLDPPTPENTSPDALFVRFFARSAVKEIGSAVVAVEDEDDDTVTVRISHPTLFGGLVETWTGVPRVAGLLADVVNGVGDEPLYLGSVASRASGTVDRITLQEDVRRALAVGDIISVNGQRTRVSRVSSDRRAVHVEEFTLDEPLHEETPVLQIPYDYADSMTRVADDGSDFAGYGSVLFRSVAGYPQGLVIAAEETCAEPGRTSRWVSRSPGHTYRYDGTDLLTSTTDADSDPGRWQTDDDLTLEAWVLPERLEDEPGAVIWGEAPAGDDSPVPSYGMWLEKAEETFLVQSSRAATPEDFRDNPVAMVFAHLFWLWFPWIRIPTWTEHSKEDPTAFHVVAHAGTRTIKSKDPVLYGRWHHFSAAYNHSFGVDLAGGGWIDGGPGASMSVPGDLTLELFFRLDDAAKGGLITRGRFGGATEEGVPYSVRVQGTEIVLEFSTPGGSPQSFSSIGANIQPGFHRVGVVREKVRETVERTATVEIEYEDEDGETVKKNVEVPDVEVVEYTSIRFYVLHGDETTPTACGRRQWLGEEAGDNRASTEIGRASNTYGHPIEFGGAFSEVRIWGRALTEEQICRDGGVAGSEDLVAWWRFEENKGRTTQDSAGENTATLYDVDWIPSPDPNGPSLVLYRNGQVLKTEPHDATPTKSPQLSVPTQTPQFSLGGTVRSGARADRMIGAIEEVRVWNEVRTQEQIQDNLFTRLRGERTKLIAYYPFDDDPAEDRVPRVDDHGPRGLHLLLGEEEIRPSRQLSTAPISYDTAQVRSALAGIPTDFHDTLQGRPGVVEYGDLQRDADGNNVGVLKRCYTYVKDGAWHLVTGYKVGDLRTEWVGQVQFNPQVMGVIEGAPPTPSENLTLGPVTEYGGYAGRTEVELVRTDGTTYTLSSSSSSGYDLSFAASAEFGASSSINLITAPLGIGTWTKILDFDLKAGFGGKVNAGASWSSEQTRSSKIEVERSSSLALAGSWEASNKVRNSGVGPRWVPSNVGMALVQSDTADVFALRLEHNGALVSLQFRPNPDIPRDWNIIHFPINPRYTKQGTLDGSIGFDARGKVLDRDYANALDYGEYSYFKPREAYALKRKLELQQQSVRAYYEDFEPEPSLDLLGMVGDGIGVVGNALDASGLSNPFAEQIGGALGSTAERNRVADAFSRRSFVNTYVWTAEGGFFSEATNLSSTFQETTGSSYTFSGEMNAGFSLELASPIAMTLEMNMSMGGNLSYTRSKSEESESSVAVNVVCNTEGDLQKYGGPRHLDGEYDAEGNALVVPGKVDAYRFMTFFLEPSADNYEDLFNKVIDPIWLAQSSSPNALALREAQQDTTRPPCWRIFHRVTFVSRILPDFGSPASTPEQESMKALDINSNYELVHRMDPFVRDSITDYVRFSDVVRGTLHTYFPELVPHQDAIVEFLALYYGVEEGIPTGSPTSGRPDPGPGPTGAKNVAELAEDDGAEHLFTFGGDTGVNDRIGSMTVHLPARGDVIETDETGLQGALALEESGSLGLIELGDRWGRDHDRTIEMVFRLDGNGRSALLRGGPETPDPQRPFESLAIAMGTDGPIAFKALPGSPPVLLPGLTLEAARGRLVYLAIRFELESEEFRLAWSVHGGIQGGNAVAAARRGSISGGRLFLGNAALDVAAHGPTIEFHHLAVYPQALTDEQLLQRVHLLGLDRPPEDEEPDSSEPPSDEQADDDGSTTTQPRNEEDNV